MCEGDFFSLSREVPHTKSGFGGGTLSQVSFYCVIRNCYVKVIFSVCLGRYPIPSLDLGGGTLSQVSFYCVIRNCYMKVIFSVCLGRYPIPSLDLGGGNIIPGFFLLCHKELLREGDFFSLSREVPHTKFGFGGGTSFGGESPSHIWGGPHPRYMGGGFSFLCGRQYVYGVHNHGHYCSNIFLSSCLCCIFRTSIK